ncbi:hypothetical protein TNCV_4131471 [Trichonephila clavipes]|nr:hypothetical protein TNCV_4131471 [Trichonephila clavipes]
MRGPAFNQAVGGPSAYFHINLFRQSFFSSPAFHHILPFLRKTRRRRGCCFNVFDEIFVDHKKSFNEEKSLPKNRCLDTTEEEWRLFSLDRSPSKRNERSFLAVQSVADCLLQMVSSDDKTDRAAPALSPGHPLNRSSPLFTIEMPSKQRLKTTSILLY